MSGFYTYQDATSHLIDVFELNTSVAAKPRFANLVRKAVVNAYRQLVNSHRWNYFTRRLTIDTVAPQTTGSVEYTASTRTVALTGATFPTNAKYYRIRIGNNSYDIESYTDSTNVVLDSLNSPSTDIASGTSYSLFREAYLLPADFGSIRNVFDTTNDRAMSKMSQNQRLQEVNDWQHQTSTPYYFTISPSNDDKGRHSIVFTPAPSGITSYDVIYNSKGSDLRTEKESTGTIDGTSGSTAVTGNSTAFLSRYVGAVFRVTSSTTNEPTALHGTSNATFNPFDTEHIIQSVSSTTALTLKSDLESTYSAVKYTISDLIDIESGSMLNLFQRMCEAEYSKLANLRNKADYIALAEAGLIPAIEADDRTPYGNTGYRMLGGIDTFNTSYTDSE